MTMPNFLVIGAAKAGTTALYHYLKQHPQIYMSPHKEPRFFALEGRTVDFRGPGDLTRFHFVTDLAAYRTLFEGVENETAIGEVSPWYLYVPQAPERIRHHIPEAKLIAVLRDPVERAYSNYLHSVREGLEPLEDFVQAMEAEEERIRNNWSYRWHYKQKGFYYGQIKRYLKFFKHDRTKIYLYEDFQLIPEEMMKDIFNFLEIDENFKINTSKKHNVSETIKSNALERFICNKNFIKEAIKPFIRSKGLRKNIKKKLYKLNKSHKKPLNNEIREKYIYEYREDILKLQDLIQRDLSQWLKV